MGKPLTQTLRALILAAALPTAAASQRAPQTPPPTDNAETGARAGFPIAGQGATEQTAGQYRYDRWAEDWSLLRDPARRDDLFDPLKYIPLDPGGEVYLTLSGDARVGFYGLSHLSLSRGAPAITAAVVRGSLGADLHLGPSFRIFGELGAADIEGRQVANLVPVYRSKLYVRQAFASYNARVLGADAGVMVGRFQFLDGPQQILSTRDIPNLQFVFNGGRAFATWRQVRVDAVDLDGITYRTGVLNTGTNAHQHFYGANTAAVLSERDGETLFLGPFYFGLADDARQVGPRVGRERLDSYGARLWGAVGSLKLDLTGERQTGTFGNRRIDAFAVYTKGDVAVPLASAPRVGWRADVASGGGPFGDGKLRDADYLFGSAPYLSYGLLFGGQNLVDAAPIAEISLPHHVKLSSEYVWLWRYSRGDAVYNVVKVPYAGTERAAGRFTGELLRLKAAWQANRHVELDAELEDFRASTAMARAGLNDSVFGSIYLQLHF